MNVKSEGKRIFGGCLLLMMAVLTICTVAFATVTRSNDSYSLDYPFFCNRQLPEMYGKEMYAGMSVRSHYYGSR